MKRALMIVVVASLVLVARMGLTLGAPAGQYTASTDTVLDNKTALVWQRAASATPRTFDEALSDCEMLSLAGNTDWRLPSVKELMTIQDELPATETSSTDPLIDAVAFPNTPKAAFWSSTYQYNVPSQVEIVHFDNTSSFMEPTNTLITTRHYVRCVRGG